MYLYLQKIIRTKKKQKKDIAFTKGEWKDIKGREYTDDNKQLEISVIQINKLTGIITVEVEQKDIQDDVGVTKQYHEITKQCVDGPYVVLENEILKLSNSVPSEVHNGLKLILEYIKKIHDYYPNLPYGASAREADEHGFVAGIFNNFRYRENVHGYLEQLVGRGYADIVLLVRGPNRATNSIPIIIELKAGTGYGTSAHDALKQAEEYTKGSQPNNMRILSLADNILCVGMNLDSSADSFMKMQVVARNQEVVPLIQSIVDSLGKISTSNQDVIKQEIQSNLEKTYNTFPGTGEKSSAHYMSRFLLGESIVLRAYDKHIFIYDEKSYIPTKIVIDDHSTRAAKKPKMQKIVDGSNAVNSILLISTDKDNPAIVLNIIDINREVQGVIKLPLDAVTVGNRKIILLDIEFRLDKYKEGFQQYCDVVIGKIYNSVLDYNNENSIKADGTFNKISFKDSVKLVAQMKSAIDSQKDLVTIKGDDKSEYTKLFSQVGEVIYPIKSLIGHESEFQGLLEGIFKYCSDIALAEVVTSRKLVLTEFQTGAGNRIDMLVQGIGTSAQGTKEYVPVGLELKYSTKHDASKQRHDVHAEHKKARSLLKKLTEEQIETYGQGAAIKSITDYNKVAIMGVIFNAKAKAADLLLLTNDHFYEAEVIYSSKLYSVSDITNTHDITEVLEVIDTSIHAHNQREFNESNMQRLINLLKANTNIQEINITDTTITTSALKNLCNYLKNHNNVVTNIDVSNSNLNNEQVKFLIELLCNNTHITSLDIRNNNAINPQTYQEINKLVYANQRFNARFQNQYSLYNVDAGHEHIQKWLDTGFSTQQPPFVHFNNCKELQNFLNQLPANTQRLDLSGLGLEDDMIPKVLDYLKSNDNIAFLDLSDNHITAEGAIKLLRYLVSHTHKISHFDISHNEIANDLCITLLARFIEKNNDLSPVLRSLNISNIGLGRNMFHIKSILDALNNTSINSLDISNNDDMLNIQDPNDANDISNMIVSIIHNHSKLESLNLSHTGINDLLIKRLAIGFTNQNDNQASIINLNISGNRITTNGMQDLSCFIGSIKKLQCLNISHNPIGPSVKSLFYSLENTSITKLGIANISLSDDAHTELNNLLKKSPINTLNISDNTIGINTLRAIFSKDHKRDKTLRNIDVSSNIIEIDDETLDIISKAIRDDNTLYSLDISNMGIDDDILASIIDILSSNNNIVHLNIEENDVDEFTMEALPRLLKKKSKLKWLNIGGDGDKPYTTIKSYDLNDLLHNIAKHKGFMALDLSYHNINLEGMNILAEFLAHNIPLQYLILTNNHLNDNAITVLLNGLVGNTQLKYLDIRYNTISKDLVDQILSFLEINIGLQVVLINAEKSTFNMRIPSDVQFLKEELSKIAPHHDLVQSPLIPDIDPEYPSIPQDKSVNQECTTALDIKNLPRNGHCLDQTFELATMNNNYRYWLQQQDIPDIARVHYHYDTSSDIEVIALAQLPNILSQYSNNIRPFTIILNLGSHWVSLVLYRVHNISYAYYIDSLGNNIDAHTKDILNNHQILVNDISIIQQTDTYNCGLWALENANTIRNILNNNINASVQHIRDSLHTSHNEQFFQTLRRTITEELSSDVIRSGHMIDFGLIGNREEYEIPSNCIAIGRHWMKRSIRNDYVYKLSLNKAFFDCIGPNVPQYKIGYELMKLVHLGTVLTNDSCSTFRKMKYAFYSKLYSDIHGDVNVLSSKIRESLSSNDTSKLRSVLDKEVKDLNVLEKISESTFVLEAVKKGDIEKTRLLIEKGANVNAKTDNSTTPLLYAIESNNTALCKYLIEAGADVNAVGPDGNTALMTAIIVKNKELTKFLIEHGADVNKQNNNGDSAISIAAVGVGMAVGAGIGGVAVVGVEGVKSAVVGTAMAGYTSNMINRIAGYRRVESIDDMELFEILRSNRADLNIVDNFGNTPLHNAVANHNVEIVESCVQHNDADINAVNNLCETPLHMGIHNLKYRGKHTKREIKQNITDSNDYIKIKKIISILVTHNANVSIQNNYGNTALHLAVKTIDKEVIKLLLSLVHDSRVLFIKNKEGDTILSIARMSHDKEVIELFVNFHDTIGSSTLHLAVANANIELVRYLIKYTANINIQDVHGNTPTHLAVQLKNDEIFQYLMENGANLNLKNTDNKTIIDLAHEYGINTNPLPTPLPNIEDIPNQDLENGYNHHKHRHHHGEGGYERAKRHINQQHTGDHHRGHIDIEDTSSIKYGKQYDKLVSKDSIGKSSNSGFDTIVQVQNTVGTKQTIQETNNLIHGKDSNIIDSVNNELTVDWQGNLLLGYLLFGMKGSNVKYKTTQDVAHYPKDQEYAHRLAYSSYVSSVEDHQAEPELLGVGSLSK